MMVVKICRMIKGLIKLLFSAYGLVDIRGDAD